MDHNLDTHKQDERYENLLDLCGDQNEELTSDEGYKHWQNSKFVDSQAIRNYLCYDQKGGSLFEANSENGCREHRIALGGIHKSIRTFSHGRGAKNYSNHLSTADSRTFYMSELMQMIADLNGKVLLVLIGGSIDREAFYHTNVASIVVINPGYDNASQNEYANLQDTTVPIYYF